MQHALTKLTPECPETLRAWSSELLSKIRVPSSHTKNADATGERCCPPRSQGQHAGPFHPMVRCSTKGCGTIEKYTKMLNWRVPTPRGKNVEHDPNKFRFTYTCWACVMQGHQFDTQAQARTYIKEHSIGSEGRKRRAEEYSRLRSMHHHPANDIVKCHGSCHRCDYFPCAFEPMHVERCICQRLLDKVDCREHVPEGLFDKPPSASPANDHDNTTTNADDTSPFLVDIRLVLLLTLVVWYVGLPLAHKMVGITVRAAETASQVATGTSWALSFTAPGGNTVTASFAISKAANTTCFKSNTSVGLLP